MSFTNKVVLVTGASSGIGAAIAIAFAEEGADVAIVGRKQEKLNNFAEEFAKIGKEAFVIRADIANDNVTRTRIKRTIDVYAKLDVLVNHAGILRFNNILDDGFIESYDTIIKTNLRAIALITNTAALYLVKAKGNIINLSSAAGKCKPKVSFTPYAVSKAALDHFTRCIALELATAGVRVGQSWTSIY